MTKSVYPNVITEQIECSYFFSRSTVRHVLTHDLKNEKSSFAIFPLKISYFICEPGHEKMCLMLYANNKGADQPTHPHSLISAYFVRCQDRII